MPNTALALLDTVTEPAIAGGVISKRVTVFSRRPSVGAAPNEL
jgi:hypothetical protein